MKNLKFVGKPDEVIKKIKTLGLRCRFRGFGKNPTVLEMMQVNAEVHNA